MASKVYAWKHCKECGRGFSVRDYPRAVAAALYCERCCSKHLEQPHDLVLTERDIHGNVLQTSTLHDGVWSVRHP